MTESEFLGLSEKTFEEIEDFVETHFPDDDVYRQGNVLTIESSDHPSVVINRQEAMQEIWLASPEGGYHFYYDPQGRLVNTRDQDDFVLYLKKALNA